MEFFSHFSILGALLSGVGSWLFRVFACLHGSQPRVGPWLLELAFVPQSCNSELNGAGYGVKWSWYLIPWSWQRSCCLIAWQFPSSSLDLAPYRLVGYWFSEVGSWLLWVEITGRLPGPGTRLPWIGEELPTIGVDWPRPRTLFPSGYCLVAEFPWFSWFSVAWSEFLRFLWFGIGLPGIAAEFPGIGVVLSSYMVPDLPWG